MSRDDPARAYAAEVFAFLKNSRTFSGLKSRNVPPDAKCCVNTLPMAKVRPAANVGTASVPSTVPKIGTDFSRLPPAPVPRFDAT